MAGPRQVADDALKHWPLEKLREVHLEMGKQCNVRCAMCYQTDFSPKSKLPEIVWKERLLPAYAKASSLVISGGEPTVMSNCRTLIEMVMRDYPNLGLVTVTNGVLFKGAWADAFLQQGTSLNFSINVIDPELYRKLMQYGRQDQVMANIETTVRRKRETGSRLAVRISTVVLDETVDELPEFVQWAVDHGLDQALVFADHFGRVTRKPADVQRKIAEAYAVADRYPNFKLIHLDDFDWYFATQHGIPPVRERALSQRAPQACSAAFDTLFVNSDGTVDACCKSRYCFGSLMRSDLLDVWNSHKAFVFRKRMMNLDFRDCLVSCDLNCRPLNNQVANARRAYLLLRRDPRTAIQKGLRKLGITSAQNKS